MSEMEQIQSILRTIVNKLEEIYKRIVMLEEETAKLGVKE